MKIRERMQAVLRAEAEAILALEVREEFVQAVQLLAACSGKVLATGLIKEPCPLGLTPSASMAARPERTTCLVEAARAASIPCLLRALQRFLNSLSDLGFLRRATH